SVPSPTTREERSLSYYVLVQKVQGGKPFGEPFRLASEMLFPAGYHIRLVFSSPQSGFFYLINEAPGVAGGSEGYNVLFPSPAADGSALVQATQETQAPSPQDYFVFDQQQGEEKLWMVWAKDAPAEMEMVKKWVNPRNMGRIGDTSEAAAVGAFLSRFSL